MSTDRPTTPAPGPAAPEDGVVVERGVPVPMRDGTVLRADVYRPASGGRFPVLVERVAYELGARVGGYAPAYVRQGYVVVGQNVRGTFASGGVLDLFRDDGWGPNRDGYETVEWAAAQPWSDGNVGMLDGSYSGFTQYLVAPTRPPHLRALSPREAGGDVFRDWVFRAGAHQLAFTRSWTLRTCLTWLTHEAAPATAGRPRRRLRELREGDALRGAVRPEHPGGGDGGAGRGGRPGAAAPSSCTTPWAASGTRHSPPTRGRAGPAPQERSGGNLGAAATSLHQLPGSSRRPTAPEARSGHRGPPGE